MAHKVMDRARETSNTTGTGAYDLDGPISGYQDFDADMATGDTTFAFVQMGSNWEVGLYTFTSGAPDQLARTTIYESSNGDAAVSWGAGIKEITGSLPARFCELLNTMEAAVASAGTCDIGAINGSRIEITGTTTITSLGTSPHKLRFVRFSSSLTLTHNATSLILPTGMDIVTAAGDTAVFASDASGNWRCWSYRSTNDLFFDYHNRLINPTGQIQQTALGSKSDGGYLGFDQWLLLSQTAACTDSQVVGAENGTPFMMRLNQDQAAAQRFGFIQWLERHNCLDLRGKLVTFSARVNLSVSANLRMAIVEWTGTADSITKDIVNDWTSSTYTAGNFFTTTSTVVTAVSGALAVTGGTLTTLSVSGVVQSTANNLAVFIWTEGTAAQNVKLDIGKAQLEIGHATPFAPRDFPTELVRCQRFLWKTFPLATAPAQNAGAAGAHEWISVVAGAVTNRSMTCRIPRMRATPTITLYNPGAANAQVRDRSIPADCSGTTAQDASDHGFWINCTGNASTAISNLLSIHAQCDARL